MVWWLDASSNHAARDEHQRAESETTMKTKTTDAKTYYFLKTASGQYLQSRCEMGTGVWEWWLADKRAWTACHDSVASAEQYRVHAERVVGPLVIVQEAL